MGIVTPTEAAEEHRVTTKCGWCDGRGYVYDNHRFGATTGGTCDAAPTSIIVKVDCASCFGTGRVPGAHMPHGITDTSLYPKR